MAGRRTRVVATAVAFGAFLLLTIGVTGLVRQDQALAAGTTLTILSGDVAVRHGGADFAAATDGQVLIEGDAIRTGADGRAVLTYFEGSTVTIEPGTELAIDTAFVAPDGGTIVVMTQMVGRTWHVVTRLMTGGSRYEVKTPASTASVRGTEFVVDSDAETTTITTTEGAVAAQISDPTQTGGTATVSVTAGNQQTQRRNARPAPAQPAPPPTRTVSVTVGGTNSLVIDPLGRVNGVTKEGKLVAQTPGARVHRSGDSVVVDLPDVPDGKIGARVDKAKADDDDSAPVRARITDAAGEHVDVQDTAQFHPDGKAASGFEVRRSTAGTTARVLTDQEMTALPSAKVTASKHSVPRK